MRDITISFTSLELETLRDALDRAKFLNPEKPQNLGKLCKRLTAILEEPSKHEHPFAQPRMMPWFSNSIKS